MSGKKVLPLQKPKLLDFSRFLDVLPNIFIPADNFDQNQPANNVNNYSSPGPMESKASKSAKKASSPAKRAPKFGPKKPLRPSDCVLPVR